MTLPNKATFIGSTTLFVLSLAAAPPLFATDIPLTNPSFESPALADGVWSTSIPGWAITGGTGDAGAGVWNPSVSQSSSAFVSGIPDGDQVGWSNGGDLEQITGDTVAPGNRYVLSVSIGGRPSYSGRDYALILAGGTTLGTMTGVNVANEWSRVTVTYTSLPGDPNAGQPLKVKLVNTELGQLNFDKVRLQRAAVATCQGFLSPFNNTLSLKKKENRAIPVKMVLRDLFGNVLTDANVSAPPKVQVTIGTDPAQIDTGYNSDLLPAGLSDEGNEFRYDGSGWIINLATKQYTGSATYTVTAVPGDDSYVIDGCSQTFTRLP